jgi:hypothetical protein
MALQTTQLCPDLNRKLAELYRLSFGRRDGGRPYKKDVHLAKDLGVGRSSVSTWRGGDDSKNRAPFYVSPAHIELLSAKLVAFLDNGITVDDARYLWTSASAVEFIRRTRGQSTANLKELLASKAPDLQVGLEVIDPTALAMISEVLEPIDGEITLMPNSRVVLYVHARKGRTLLVLGETLTEYLLLVPSQTHDGRVTSVPERVPSKDAWTLTLESGGAKFVVVECGASVPIPARGRNENGVLDAASQEVLVQELLDPDRAGDWRWGEVDINVSSAAGSSS